MREEVKKEWVEALRSGKYAQGYGALRNVVGQDEPDEFCCLGVLCDLRYPKGWQVNSHGDGMLHRGARGIPSEGVTFELGLNRDDVSRVANINDSGKSFSEVADWIEENL